MPKSNDKEINMYDALLVLHLIGVSIGAGTGIYLAAVSRYSARNMEQAEARTLMPGIIGTISKVGHIGLGLLLVSGILMVAMLNIAGLKEMFWLKMALVAVLFVYVGLMSSWGHRLKNGDTAIALRMKKVSAIGPPLGILIIVCAVLAFHAG
jgi:uncharacterized membrane protein